MAEPCYECENYNHIDCRNKKTSIDGKTQACACWCTKPNTKYYNIIMNKTKVRG